MAFGMAAQSGVPAQERTDDASVELVLIEAARHDPRAFAPLYDRYFPAIHGYCLRRLGHPENAADATSQIFINALQSLPKFRPERKRTGSSFRSWLFAIAHNVIVDIYRRQRVTEPVPDEAMGLIDGDPLPDELAIAADASRQLRTALGHLPEVQRSIVELRLSGLRRAEIANVLQMSDAAVRSAQARAFLVLRQHLAADAAIPEIS